jgi:AraC family transcriptional regulator of adaptative response / DNA-3-methyladenine glycosylase II
VVLDPLTCYRALEARDARFDGLFFVGVGSTGIYCRCVCTAKLPKSQNCRFFSCAAHAEAKGFRPCLRCRPELAPGRSQVDAQRSLALKAARLIESGALADMDLEQLALRLQISDRHLRRVMVEELGVTPVAYAQTCRLLSAKRMLTDTRLPVGEIALVSGFKSVRRMNTVFQERYALTPTDLRRSGYTEVSSISSELGYRPPFDWAHHLDFLRNRRIEGVELIDADSYRRTARFGKSEGIVRVSHLSNRTRLVVEVSDGLAAALPKVISGVRRLFDVDANPAVINEALGDLAASHPGIRLPGAFHGFEAAVRAILGQQVSVKFATQLAGGIAARFGAPIETGIGGLTHVFPSAARLAEASQDDVASCGVIGSRARAILVLAKEVASERLVLSPLADYEETREKLVKIPGIGPWTAEYLCMRALGWPDAFPCEDLGVFKAFGTRDRKRSLEMAERYRPWRAYAVMHLWKSLSAVAEGTESA